ncbi:hypothetical protein MST27_18345 [Pseudomonas sp. PS1]|uniref:Uncharacterized protein n=1 Tax=Stutzerimonas marianensis TaxID=2929513 RepID=A0A9X2ATW1_9GAMM|nr:hypothetical protein [Pseudomonas marianensis]MCJ0975335.1 hypothetical protein [Pseudomonas marianensis]
MRGTDSENDRQSTADEDPLPRLRRRYFASLVLLGLLFGSFLGRVFKPGPVQLLRVEPTDDGLRLWFDREPELYSQDVEGAVGMLFQAQGEAQNGQIELTGVRSNWRVQTTERGLLLHLVATRPLVAQWHGEKVEGGWRLDLQVRPRG